MGSSRTRSEIPETLATDPDVTLPAAAVEGHFHSGLVLPPRYEDLGPIASGGFGEVRRVHDRLLGRVLAMKLLRPEHGKRMRIRARFSTEATLTAGLSHPGIVAVHDRGELADGRLWFTMQEVRGRTLHSVLDELHAQKTDAGFATTPSGWTFRRVLDAFMRVAQAVGYAHTRGVVHRDLKPENLMVGEFGEVLVMDWGIARRIGDDGVLGPEPDLEVDATDSVDRMTRAGDVLGTPAYMPPEQAAGRPELHGPASDVYSLGGVLYHVLTGRPPRLGEGLALLRQVIAGAPTPIAEAARGGPPLPAELVAICERAMQRDIAARYPDASALADELVMFLDGSRRREQALAIVERAATHAPRARALRARSESLARESTILLEATRPFDPVEKKAPAWERAELASELAQEAALAETEWLQGLYGALSVDPDLREAHDALSEHYRARLVESERERRAEDATRFEVLLRAHDRGRHAAFLRGHGALSLVTDPPGARVRLHRYVAKRRRLVPELVRELGPTPLHAIGLERGSYLCEIHAPGRIPVRYPVLIERDGHWDGVPPGATEAAPIPLPALDALSSNEIYVPAGYAWIGGDRLATDALPSARVWIDGFVVGRHPVTNGELLAFLNDHLERGLRTEALSACPRLDLGPFDASSARFVFAESAGRFVLQSPEGAPLDADAPALLVTWEAAVAFTRWAAARTGRPYRLLDELEREKAARGADARFYPWGDHFDPTWACVLDSHPHEAAPASVHAFPEDESPYGVRSLAGNARDFCQNLWTREGPAGHGERLRVVAASADAADFRAVRGGAWSSLADLSRAAVRFAMRPGQRRPTTGLRLARSFVTS